MRLKEFFCFNKSDRQVLFVLLAAIGMFLTATHLLRDKSEEGDTQAADSLSDRRTYSRKQKAQDYYRVEGRKAELFPFDPNTADSTDLLHLGLQPWQVRNIYRYRAAGGVYRKPQDFARLYGLTVKQYRALAPYIHISADYQPASTLFEGRSSYGNSRYEVQDTRYGTNHEVQHTSTDDNLAPRNEQSPTQENRYPTKLKLGEQIALNDADTNMLRRVPGIGSYYARKIARYRERLGGYYSTHQLLEIEGFPEDALPYFNINKDEIHRLNVNKLSAAQLRSHPYISYLMAKAITDYRRLKGPLHSLQDLHLLPEFTPEIIQRLEPYLEF